MKKLIFILFLFSASLNAQILRTNPFYLPSVASETPEGTTLTDGLLVYYNLDENGLTFDDEVGTNDATGVSVSQNTTYKILGSSQGFDDNEDYIYFPSAGTTPDNDKITLSAWVRMSTMPSTLGHASVITLGATSTGGYRNLVLYIDTDNKPVFLVTNTTNTDYTVTGSGALSVNTLYHIVGICRGNGQTLQIYVNNSDVSSSAGTFSGTGFYGDRTNVVIGNGGTPGTEAVIGIIDEFGLWDRSVSVDSLWNGGSGITHPFQ